MLKYIKCRLNTLMYVFYFITHGPHLELKVVFLNKIQTIDKQKIFFNIFEQKKKDETISKRLTNNFFLFKKLVSQYFALDMRLISTETSRNLWNGVTQRNLLTKIRI